MWDAPNQDNIATRDVTHMKFWLPLLLILAGIAPASAQLQLPGAFTGADPGPPPTDGLPKAKPRPAPVRVPGEESLLERELYLNGRSGRLEFARAGKDLVIRKLKMTGDVLSRPGESCEVDVVSGDPIALKSEGRPNGVIRYSLALPACPFAFDVLDGAALADNGRAACEFKAADCRVDPAGFWGPTPNAFTPARIKDFERARVSAEHAMRDGFRAMLAAAKGKEETRKVAGEQAGFSAEREMICRDYAREETHGFCGLRVTEARAASLGARLGRTVSSEPPKPKKKPKPRPVEIAPPAATGGTF